MKLKINVVKFQTQSFLVIHRFHYCYENSLLLHQIITFFFFKREVFNVRKRVLAKC